MLLALPWARINSIIEIAAATKVCSPSYAMLTQPQLYCWLGTCYTARIV